VSGYSTFSIFPVVAFGTFVHMSRPFSVGKRPTYFEAVAIAHFGFPVGFFLSIYELVVIKSDPFLPISCLWFQILETVIS
jgi:hypothetical protein